MPPTVVDRRPEAHLNERTPLGPLRLAHQAHLGLGRGAVGLARVAGDARAHDVLPGGRAAAVAGNHVVEVQVAPIEGLAAVLAGVPVALEEVVPGELDLLLGETVEAHQQDHPGHPDPERHRTHRSLGVRRGPGQVAPLLEVEGPIIAVAHPEHHLGVPLEEKRQRPADRADVDRLPQPVEDEDLIAEDAAHRWPSKESHSVLTAPHATVNAPG